MASSAVSIKSRQYKLFKSKIDTYEVSKETFLLAKIDIVKRGAELDGCWLGEK